MNRRTTTIALAMALAAGTWACGDDDGGGAEAFCAVQERLEENPTFNWDPFSPDFEAAATAHIEELDELDAAAPDEVRADVATMRAFVGTFRDAFADVDREDDAAIAAAEAEIEDSIVGYDEASDAVARYADDNCAPIGS